MKQKSMIQIRGVITNRWVKEAAIVICLTLMPCIVLAGDKPLVVGIKASPPFTIKDADGTWRGISVDLWRQIARENGWEYELREMPLTNLLTALKAGEVDVAMAALTISAERERNMDFSHPYFTSGLGIATPRQASRGWLSALEPFVSWAFAKVVATLTVVLFIFGFLVWLFERKRNAEQFGGTTLDGLGSAFWWSAVTMTTVGYGDKTPRTFWGRMVGLIWMFTAIIVISGFTAAITSSLTVSRLDGDVTGLQDLYRVRTGATEGSSGESYLKEHQIPVVSFPDMDAGLEALSKGRLEAFVYDAPLLRYAIQKRKLDDLTVIAVPSHKEYYGLAFPTESTLREPLNRLLLQKQESPKWKEILESYLGTMY